ncbi:MAG TPA: UDP-glucose/GDP-mannose dehydrogenase family protein [Rhabdochlamydiaceae bacterium]|jgi:UDPglucose 6-dehydrogenase
MNILMIGVGYVGLVTAVCFAEMGHQLICLDIDEEKIENLKRGVIPIYEPGLKDLLERNAAAGRLIFTASYKEAIPKTSVCFIAVPTPSQKDGSCDLSYVMHAATEIAQNMEEAKTIVIKSTVPLGFAQQLKKHLQSVLDARGASLSFDIVSNPEFLKEGSAIQDCMKPDRVVLGISRPQAEKVMRDIYSAFMLNRDRICVMDTTSAEMTKYASNAMLATRISFMNELSLLCEKVGASINQVRIGIGSDQRIGMHFLYAGAGYGGSCFPKDLRALLAIARNFNIQLPILEAVEYINEKQKRALGAKVLSYFSERSGIQDKTIALLGLSFKPDTDDLREAPSLVLIDMLLSEGARLKVFDPVSIPNAKKILKGKRDIAFCHDEYETVTGASALVLITEWKQFRYLDFGKIGELMEEKVIFDGRNQYHPQEMLQKGFTYFGIGIPAFHKELADIFVPCEESQCT